MKSAVGLYDTRFLSIFPGKSIVGILVRATADPKKSQYTVETPSGTKSEGMAFRGEHHEYIVGFDRNGAYQKTVELPDR